MLAAIGLPEIILLVLVLAIGFALGTVLLQWLRRREAKEAARSEDAVFAVALGLGAMAYATLALGALQLFYGWIVKALVVIAIIVFLPLWRREWHSFRFPRLRPRTLTGFFFGILLLAFSVTYLLAALSPETEFDALNYHLGVPRLYIAHHGIYHVPNIVYSNYPFGLEMLFSFGWLLYSPLLAKLLHFALGMLTAAGCATFCRRHVKVPGAGLLAALLFLASPMVGYLCMTAYVDLGLACFVLLSLYAFVNWTESRLKSDLALSAVFSALALGTKYLGLVAVVMITVAALYDYLRERRATEASARTGFIDSLRPLLTYFSLAVLLFSPWLVKNFLLVGNPVAPLLTTLIPTRDFGAAEYDALVRFTNDWGGYADSLWNYLRSPWLLTQHGELFAGTPGPVYLVFFPFALFLGWRKPALRYLAICAAAGYLFLIAGTKLVRYYVPLFPLISIVIAGGLLCGREAVRNRSHRAFRLGLLAPLWLLVFLQLPWFSPLWQGHGILTLRTSALRFFTSRRERQSYREEARLGKGASELYEFLQDRLPERDSILALAPVYQSLTDHPVYMPPNSSAANDPALRLIDAGLSAQGLNTVHLRLREADPHRYWTLQVSSFRSGVEPSSYLPRFFNEQDGRALEMNYFGRRNRLEGKCLSITIDLGTPRRVSEIRLWDHATARHEFKVFAGERQLNIQARSSAPAVITPREVAKACARHGIRHIVYRDIPGIDFIPRFLESEKAAHYFRPVENVAGYRVYSLIMSPS